MNSPALVADGNHARVDGFVSLGVIASAAVVALGLPALLAGSVLCCAGLMLGGRRVRRTAYRPDPWLAPEWIVAGCGICAAALLSVIAGYLPAALNPSFYPLSWPQLPLLPTIAIAMIGKRLSAKK